MISGWILLQAASNWGPALPSRWCPIVSLIHWGGLNIFSRLLIYWQAQCKNQTTVTGSTKGFTISWRRQKVQKIDKQVSQGQPIPIIHIDTVIFTLLERGRMHPLLWLQDLNLRHTYCIRSVFLISAILGDINFKNRKKCWKDLSHFKKSEGV